MRKILFAIAITGLGFAVQPSPTEAREGPFCLIGGAASLNTRGDCAYWSYEQCQAAASGTYSTCDRNYFFQDAQRYDDLPPPPRRTRRHH